MAGIDAAQQPIAIVVLGNGALVCAHRIQQLYPQAVIYGLQQRVEDVDKSFSDFGATLRELYGSGHAIIALCAAGIVIRTLASLLADKDATNKSIEPPVLAVAEDGSAVVPLLGGIGGVNVMAREIGSALGVAAAITTSGELRFGTCLLNPPAGYVLADIEQGKRFVADLLGGQRVRIDGDAFWLNDADLPLDNAAQHTIRITATSDAQRADELIIYPRTIVAAVSRPHQQTPQTILAALRDADLAAPALACIVAAAEFIGSADLHNAAQQLAVPLRFVDASAGRFDLHDVLAAANIENNIISSGDISVAIAAAPFDASIIGKARGRLTVIGLGPGAAELMVPAAKTALLEAEDILGYETYVRMAGPFRPEQVLHCSDNREEIQRARHAFELAAQGRRVVVVSSGDPGVFAMAAAVLEALEESSDADWHAVELQIFPGVSAALATAARAGAPLGHDFCIMSLSDNLKPWAVIETRLEHAAQADFVMAFYNPISRARPWQLGRALEIIGRHRNGSTLVVLGRDIGRPAEQLTVTTLAELRPDQVDMRTLVIIGSSTTRSFARNGGNEWVYTPRWYR